MPCRWQSFFRFDGQSTLPEAHLDRIRVALEARDLDRANEWIDAARVTIEATRTGPWATPEASVELTVLSARRFLLAGDFDSALVQAGCIGGGALSAGRRRALSMTALLLKFVSLPERRRRSRAVAN